jgi:hypothetical protein
MRLVEEQTWLIRKLTTADTNWILPAFIGLRFLAEPQAIM